MSGLKLSVTLYLLLFFMPLSVLFSQALPNITILPFDNPSKDLQIDVISANAVKTAELNLKMLNKYKIIPVEKDTDNVTELWLKKCSDDNSLDNILFGSCSFAADGTISFTMSVFSRKVGKITLTRGETAENIFEIFDASDRLVLSLLEAFSGTHMGFGSVRLHNNGSKGNFSVYIDGIFAGSNIEEIPKILIGNRKIAVKQNRMLGEYTVREDVITVSEGLDTGFEYSIPPLLEKEIKAIGKHEKFIDSNWTDLKRKNRVSKAFRNLDKLLADSSYSSEVAAKKESIELKKSNWMHFVSNNPEKKEQWLFPVSTGFYNGGSTLQGGVNFCPAEKYYFGLSFEYYGNNMPPFFAVPSLIISSDPDIFLQKIDLLYLPIEGSGVGVLAYGIAYNRFLFKIELSLGSLPSSISAGYVVYP